MNEKGSCVQGKIVKGIAGFYYVHVAEAGIYECKAKGAFRKSGEKPLIGDDVHLTVLNEQEKRGNVIEIMPRKNELIRPAAANVDQALVVFAVEQPTPHFNLLDRFLIMMESKKIPVVLCFNKTDLTEQKELDLIQRIYAGCHYQMVFTSTKSKSKISDLKQLLLGYTTVIAGPSGVGKSSLINLLQEEVHMETNEISEKIARGKHTTRHSELIAINATSYIMDTPGFSSMYTNDFQKEELKFYFQEFEPYEGLCRFKSCEHINEPGCKVKDALKAGTIHPVRYKNYVDMFMELKEKRRY